MRAVSNSDAVAKYVVSELAVVFDFYIIPDYGIFYFYAFSDNTISADNGIYYFGSFGNFG